MGLSEVLFREWGVRGELFIRLQPLLFASRVEGDLDIGKRIGMWTASVLLSIALLSLVVGLLQGNFNTIPVIFRVGTIFALPMWCLFLPLIAFRKDSERRTWVLFVGGGTIGPAAIAVGALIAQLKGGDVEAIWNGDPLTGVGAGLEMIFSLIVGVLTTTIYVVALRSLTRRSTKA